MVAVADALFNELYGRNRGLAGDPALPFRKRREDDGYCKDCTV